MKAPTAAGSFGCTATARCVSGELSPNLSLQGGGRRRSDASRFPICFNGGRNAPECTGGKLDEILSDRERPFYEHQIAA